MMKNELKNNGVIFNIQRYSIHDGPGIRTTVFLKGCPLSCSWCQNPESQDTKPEIFFNKDYCKACRTCVSACPNNANAFIDNILSMDRDKCEGCGKCVETCLNGARTLVGRYASVDEIMIEIMKDILFYNKSGGGVTLSGGDPIMQPEFVIALLERCKADGLHTAIETCGYAPWPTMERLLESTDLFLFDIKCMDPEKHRKSVGRSNDLILENAVKIARKKPMKIRVPIIPGFNDNPREIQEIAQYVKTMLGGCTIDLLPYNRMGERKYERLGRTFFPLVAIDENRIGEFRQIVDSCLQS